MAKRNLRDLQRSATIILNNLRDTPRRAVSAIDNKVLNAFNVLERKKLINPRQAKRIRIGIETQQVLNKPWYEQSMFDVPKVLDRNVSGLSAKQLEDISNRRLRREYRPQKGERVPFSVRMDREKDAQRIKDFERKAAITSLRNKKEEGSGIRRKYFSDWIVQDSGRWDSPPDEIEPEFVRTTMRGLRNNPSYSWRDNWIAYSSKLKPSGKPDANRMIRDTKQRMKESAFIQRALRTPATPLSEKASQSAMKLASKYRTARNVALGAGVSTAALGTALGVYMARNAKKS
jgi:hypothetical protein